MKTESEMPLKIAIQMDAIESINIDRDTGFVLGLEAQKRGHQLYYYRPFDLFLKNGEVCVNIQQLKLRREKNNHKDNHKDNHFELGPKQQISLQTMDVVLMRQDPPYDMNYLTYTYMLERIHPKTLVINNPREVRNCPEKLFIFNFPEYLAPTLISSNYRDIHEFKKEHGQIIVKPLYAYGGADVFKIDNDLDLRLDELFLKYNTPVIAQKFLKDIALGDKRIILINGEPVGALNRIPQEGSIRSNLVQGGTAQKTTLSTREKQICMALKDELIKRELFLVGIDVIGGYLTEINVTSPTGVQVINQLYNVCLEVKFWDLIEKKLAITS